ncbi:type 4a pilus biogenesis protein PilO [Candidatus Daviesbacteria bacterium]|nr:type 4a pilus biogenesis protein PilO [Candidatus Daviesbacteria bacterium]
MLEKLPFKNIVPEKYRIFILPVGSVLVCLILLIFVVIPQFIRYLTVNKTLEETKQKQTILSDKLNSLQQIDQNVYKENIDVALAALPDNQDVTGAVGQLLFLVSNNRLKLNALSFSNVTANTGKIQSFQIKMEIAGNTDTVKNFISQLAKIPRILKLDKIEVIGLRKSNDVQASMSMLAYFEELPKSIGEVEQPLPAFDEKDVNLLTKIKSAQRSTPITTVTVASGPKGKKDPFE